MLDARVVQVRAIVAGDGVGYGATWRARRDSRIAVLAIGYADGLPRAAAPAVHVGGRRQCPVVGRVSMDLCAADMTGCDVAEGDWIALDFDLARAAACARRSQYELLTRLGRRYARVYK